jgi:hypothetical protein
MHTESRKARLTSSAALVGFKPGKSPQPEVARLNLGIHPDMQPVLLWYTQERKADEAWLHTSRLHSAAD